MIFVSEDSIPNVTRTENYNKRMSAVAVKTKEWILQNAQDKKLYTSQVKKLCA